MDASLLARLVLSTALFAATLPCYPGFAATASAARADTTKELGEAGDRYKNLELFQNVLHYVESNYVDPVKNKELVYGAIKGMLETLDPHSNFLTPDVFKDMQTETSGKFGGLGIEIGMKDNVLTVVSPIEDTPAWKAGIKPNDRIVKINGESTKGMTLVEAVAKMRGDRGSEVKLSIYREGFDRIRDLSIKREIIKIIAVKSEELEPTYGYVVLSSFNESAGADIRKAIMRLQEKQKLRGLVLDLRYNPGGLLDQAVEVSSLFVDDGVIVSTIGRNRDQKEVKYARRGLAFEEFPVAILVNSSTASAAEIVSGALQDHHRAIIMGQPTFGKGSVQQVISLGNDLGLKLTIARYYTPSGRSIQEKGVQPDIILDDFDSKILTEARRKADAFRERDLKGHMVNTDSESSGGAVNTRHDDFKKDELDALGRSSHDKGHSAEKSHLSKADRGKDKEPSIPDDDEMAPLKMSPREDYQVREALNYLKSYDVFRKLSVAPVVPQGASVIQTASSATGKGISPKAKSATD